MAGLGAVLEPSRGGLLSGRLGASFGPLGVVLGRLGGLSGIAEVSPTRSEAETLRKQRTLKLVKFFIAFCLFGHQWMPLWAFLPGFWGILGYLGASWVHLGAVGRWLDRLGLVLEHLAAVLGRCLAVSEPSRAEKSARERN